MISLVELKPVFYDWYGANTQIFYKINHFTLGPAYEELMLWISASANHRNFPIYVGILMAIMLLSTLRKKFHAGPDRSWKKPHFYRWLGVFAVLIGSYAANGFILYTLKVWFSYPRPFQLLPTETVRLLADPMSKDQYFRSFPSGHAAFATMMAASIWPLLNRPLAVLATCLVLLVYCSRIVLGEHFPADVLGGCCVSLVVVQLMQAVWHFIMTKWHKDPEWYR